MPFDYKKALCALPGKIVITDEDSPFEWVGSNNASTCIIILIHGTNWLDKNVAVCGHLSEAESPSSLHHMLSLSGIINILSVYLVSGETKKEDNVSQILLTILRDKKVENLQLSLGEKMTEAAINVKTGEITYQAAMVLENTGDESFINDPHNYLMSYTEQGIHNIKFSNKQKDSLYGGVSLYREKPMLTLGVDGRNPNNTVRIQSLLENAEPPIPRELKLSATITNDQFVIMFAMAMGINSLDLVERMQNAAQVLISEKISDNEKIADNTTQEKDEDFTKALLYFAQRDHFEVYQQFANASDSALRHPPTPPKPLYAADSGRMFAVKRATASDWNILNEISERLEY